ncbi:DotA/TraY family protein [Massilia orientalis]|uniref:DotA/TraY family protein n=1 Tax=Massilia orientalis TaxID=3050128 RepID=A0ACC7MDW1_9BURK|nr:DotA/TraY family protein [Massilia sp. YIM B02787]
MRKPKNPLYLFTALVALACLVMPEVAYADEGILDKVAGLLTSINRNTDESFGMLRAVLGDFALDPFRTQDGSTGSLMASMFKEFNMFIFSAACIWTGYNMIAGLAQTMHEGVVLGKRMSTVWVPVRISFGTASLMPVFGGWAFCQALMVIACLLGIAGANRVTNVAVDSTAAFQTTVNPMGNVKQAAQIQNIELYMAKAAACQRASYDMATAMQASGQATPTDFPVTLNASAESGTAIVMQFAGRQSSGQYGNAACGEIKLKFSPRSNGFKGMFGFRIADVNYEGIRTRAMEAHATTLSTTYSAAQAVILGVSPSSTPAQFDASVKAVADGYFGLYTNTFQAKLATLAADVNNTSNAGAISDQLTQRMKDGGWATLGIWYSVYAEVGEAMNEMLDPVVTFQPLDDGMSMSSTTADLLAGLEAAVGVATSQKQGALATSTGNTSIGQWILGGALNMTMGASSTGASNTVNPIIAFKNIGDNGLAAAQSIYIAYKTFSATTGGTIGSAVMDAASSKIGSSLIGKIPVVGGIANTLMSIAKDAGALLLPVVGLLFVTAAVMAFYIPMVPFIQWFAALIQWFTSVIESLIGSSLWAMAHFDSDGEGMGQRTSYGYTYMLNNFARPIIMTFSFFIASAAITVMGTYLFRYFGAAVGSAQGNSLTGLMSIVAYMVIFTVMGMTLVNSTFTMMLHLADRMIGWIGQNQNAAIGHEVENKVAGIFVAAARGGSGAVASAMDPRRVAAKKGLLDSVAGKTLGTAGGNSV